MKTGLNAFPFLASLAKGWVTGTRSRRSFRVTETAAFDFTPIFEDTVLSILPSILLLLVLPYRVYKLYTKRVKVSQRGFLHASKIILLVLFAATHLILLVLQWLNSFHSNTAVTATALALVCSLGLIALSHFEHFRSLRPSLVISAYLLLTLVFDIARVRTMAFRGVKLSLIACFSSMMGVKAVVLLFEAIEKRGMLLEPYRYLSPEETCGLYSRSSFFWLIQLLSTGYSRLLCSEDLYPIESDMKSETLRDRMEQAWSAAPKGQPRAFFWAVLRANSKALSYGILPRMIQIAFRYTQPFLLTRTVSFANDLSQSDSVGWGLTGAFVLVLLGLAVSNAMYFHMTYRFVVGARGSIVSIIYSKTLSVSLTALDESAAVTLMSNDTQAICHGFEMVHDFWAAPLEVGIALYLMSRQLGISSIVPAILALASAISIMSLSRIMNHAQKIWMQSIQTRVHETASMLGSIKPVKMLGFTDWLCNIIQGLRVSELSMAVTFRKLLIVRVFFGNIMTTLAPFLTLTAYSLVERSFGHALNMNSAYTVLTLISLVSGPVSDLILAVPLMNTAIASLDRIQSFLESDERRDPRVTFDQIPSLFAKSEPSAQTGLTFNSCAGLNLPGPSQVVTVRNASLSWLKDDKPVIKNIDFEIAVSHFCFIMGPVGCGKSTLLKGILGETPFTKGFVYTRYQEMAFVDQTPWICNTSFRDNIVGSCSYEEKWYEEVVRACALDEDMALLPNGHWTQVGSSGIALSGGQKQRLALARAVYARKKLTLLDDVFSGLDANTEEHICKHLFSRNGIFCRLGTTVVLVTHTVHRLAYADHIIILSPDGSITEQGTLEKLKVAGGYVTDLEARYRAASNPEKVNKPLILEKSAVGSTNVMEENVDNELNAAEKDLSRRGGDFSLYSYYLSSAHSVSALIWASCFMIFGISSKLSELLVKFWTAATEKHGNAVDSLYLGLYGMLAILTTAGLVGGLYHYILYFAPKSAQVLHERLVKSVMNAPLSFFASVDSGTTLNRFSQDMTLVDTDLPYALTDFILSVSTGLMSAIIMCISARYFAATMPLVFLLMWLLQKFYLRTSRQMRLLDLEFKSPLFSQFTETLSGLATIRAFGWTPTFKTQHQVLLDVSQKPFYLLFCIQRWLELTLDFIVTGLCLILMVMIVKLRSEIGASYVGLAILNVITFSQSLSTILRNWTSLETSIGAIARIREFVQTTENENQAVENVPLPCSGGGGNSTLWPPSGAIKFYNVSASYHPGKGKDRNLAIRNINMSIQAGEKIGICGRSGSGKSSLLATLFRMIEVEPGSQILIDGIDITRTPRQQLRTALNAIPQEPFTTYATVRANADPLGTHTNNEIEEALRSVELWETVQSKGGLDAKLDSCFFSHGQKQLFCLARGLLRGGKVIVLDEITSNVDVVSDALMQRIIRDKFVDCTVLAVAHRLDTILDFDRVAVMRGGELIELDNPQSLLLSRESAFKELYESR